MATAKAAPKPRKKTAAPAETADPKPQAAPKAGVKSAKAKAKPEAVEPPPRTESTSGAEQAGAAGQAAFPPFETLLSPDQLKMVETLSANLARAAVTAQGAIAEAAASHAHMDATMSRADRLSAAVFDAVTRQGAFSRAMAQSVAEAGASSDHIRAGARQIGDNAQAGVEAARGMGQVADRLAAEAHRLERRAGGFIAAISAV